MDSSKSAPAKSESGGGNSFFKAVSYLNPVKRGSEGKDESKGGAAGAEPPRSSLSAAASKTGASLMKGVKGGVRAVNYLNPVAYDHDSDSEGETSSEAGGSRNLVEKPEQTEVMRKKESALAVMLRSAKNKFVEKGLEGKIAIQILYGVITSGEFCSVSRTDTFDAIDDDEIKQLGVLNYKATSAMDAIIANLNRRAKQYDSEELRGDVTLTQGVTFGVTIPFINVGFQTSIQFEVTAESLIAYRKRKNKLRAFLKRLKAIPNAEDIIKAVVAGGFTREVAQRAVVATNGAGESQALRWAADHDNDFSVSGGWDGGDGFLPIPATSATPEP